MKGSIRRLLGVVMVLMLVIVQLNGVKAAKENYFANDANKLAFNFINLNNGVYHNNKTYVAYNGVNMEPMVTYYDHETDTWGETIQAGEIKLPNTDNHGTPSLAFDANGYLHMIYGGHSGNGMTHLVTENPEDITSWVEQTDINNHATYIQLHQLPDKSLVFFYRGGDHPEDWKISRAVATGDQPATFGEEYSVLDCVDRDNAFYAWSKMGPDGALHVNFVRHDCNPCWVIYRFNVYYFKISFDENGVPTYTNTQGEDLTSIAPISIPEADTKCKVFDSGNRTINGITTFLEETSPGEYTPHVFASIRDLSPSWQHLHFRRNDTDTGWIKAEVAESYGQWDRVVGVWVDDELQAMVSSGGNIERWRFNANNQWEKVETAAPKPSGGSYGFGSEVFNTPLEACILFQEYREVAPTVPVPAYMWGIKDGVGKFYGRDFNTTPQPQTIMVNDDAAGITYSNGYWYDSNNRPYAEDYNGDVHCTKTQSAYIEYTFTGTGIDYITEKHYDMGNVEIFIDGVSQGLVNCYYSGGRTSQQVMFSKKNLTNGTHTIKIVKTSGTWMLLDAFRVYTE